MLGGNGTGPYGTFINCTDPTTGLRRPLYRYRYGGYIPPVPPTTTPMTYLTLRSPTYQRYYGYASWSYPYRGYGYPRYWYHGYGYGLGIRRGRGRGRGRW